MPERLEHVLDWRCGCEAVHATVHHRPRIDRFFHAICHCRDCQAFQHALGCADQVLDPHGGTAVVGTSPAAFRVTRGAGELSALRLGPKGLLRWHTRCCNTPIGATPASRTLPHLGLTAAVLAQSAGEDAVAEAFGPVRRRIYGASAPSGSAPDAHPRVPLGMLPSVLSMLAGRVRRGEQKLNQFFGEDGEPTVTPRLLDKAERDALPPYQS